MGFFVVFFVGVFVRFGFFLDGESLNHMQSGNR